MRVVARSSDAVHAGATRRRPESRPAGGARRRNRGAAGGGAGAAMHLSAFVVAILRIDCLVAHKPCRERHAVGVLSWYLRLQPEPRRVAGGGAATYATRYFAQSREQSVYLPVCPIVVVHNNPLVDPPVVPGCPRTSPHQGQSGRGGRDGPAGAGSCAGAQRFPAPEWPRAHGGAGRTGRRPVFHGRAAACATRMRAGAGIATRPGGMPRPAPPPPRPVRVPVAGARTGRTRRSADAML